MKHWSNSDGVRRFGLLQDVLFSERLKRERIAGAIFAALAIYVITTIHQDFIRDYGADYFDQRRYLISVEAFAAGNLSPERHWYPLLYSLVGALFYPVLPSAPFFFVNLFSCVITALMFVRICSTFEVPTTAGIAALLISLIVPTELFAQFVMPWNTIPVTALTLTCIHLVTRPQPLSPRATLALAGAATLIPLLRPTDALSLLPIAVAGVWRLRKQVRLIIAGAALSASLLGAYFALHFAIYGLDLPPYIALSKGVGFDFGRFAEKSYGLFVDPEPLYGVGEGLSKRAPWVVLAPYGAVIMALRFGWRGAIAPLCAVITFVIYVGYADLTPYSFWRHFNVHYLSGALLIAAACSAVAAVKLFAEPIHLAGLALFAAGMALIDYDRRLTSAAEINIPDDDRIAITCDGCGEYDAIEIRGVRIDQWDLYQTSVTSEHQLNQIFIGGRVERNIHDFRLIPQADGVRIVFDRPRHEPSMVVRFSTPHGLRQQPDVQFIDGRFQLRAF